MDLNVFLEGLIQYLDVVIIITFHEFGHAWTSSKCGDDTARLQGRITLNPVAHMDRIGTVILPLLVVFLSAAGSGLGRFIIGWGKPVPVNDQNLRRPDWDDLLVAMAGPAMNVILAFAALGLARLGLLADLPLLRDGGVTLARLSMLLCFFNLLPIPPLDGSYLLKRVTRMSRETYLRFSRYGFFAIILVIQIPQVRLALLAGTEGSLSIMARLLLF
jgi:Zn-dependent protease